MLNSRALLPKQLGGTPAPTEGRARVGTMPNSSSEFEQSAEIASEWNPAYFEGVVDKYQPRIYRFIYSMVGDSELAHDLTQDTFLSAYKNLCKRAENPHEYENQTYNMQAWLYTIARNAALSELRRRKIVRFFSFWQRSNDKNNHDETDTMMDMAYQEPGGSLELQTVISDELNRAIEMVGRERLTALFLYMDGFSYKEICEITNSSLPGVKSQIFRAKESLRKVLSELDKGVAQ
jgi:RNA polymerase sigma-70 factor (ECF subfamily)